MTISVSEPPLARGAARAATDLDHRASMPVPAVRPARAGSLVDRVLRIARALLVGGWASVLDFAVVAVCIRALALDPMLARFAGLIVSGFLLFFGSRSFAFRAKAGSIASQARRFVGAELVGLGLNLLVFRELIARIPILPPEVASQVANTLVFVAFAYPVRVYFVFRVPAPNATL